MDNCPSPKQSTWDWIWILGDIGGDHPHHHPLGVLLALHISARGILDSYSNTPLKKFMIIMDYLQDEHNRYYTYIILKCFPSLHSSEVELMHILLLSCCFMQFETQC